MGVYIKGMEMPKDGCRDCIFVNRKWHGFICPILKREVTGNVERGGFQTDCPLVEIPPHGRLIDADALKARLFPEKIDGIKTSISVSCMKLVIDDAPTIIPAEPPKEET